MSYVVGPLISVIVLLYYLHSRLYAFDSVGHQQTGLQTLIKDISARIFSSVQYERELLVLSDGGTVALDWVQICAHFRPEAPTVVMMHGLCGSSASEYLIHVVEVLISKGFR
jgi:predicted alpha/beta-fold hydrolase